MLKIKAYSKGDTTMEHTTAYHEDVMAVWQSDKYGHPQRVKVTEIAPLTPMRPLATSQADRYGHALNNDRVKGPEDSNFSMEAIRGFDLRTKRLW